MNLPKIYSRQNTRYWWIAQTIDGEQQLMSGRAYGLTRDIPKDFALRILYKQLGIEDALPDPEPVPVSEPEVVCSLGWLKEETIRRVEREGWRKGTVREYRIALTHLCNFLGEEFLLADLKRFHVTQFQEYLLGIKGPRTTGNSPLTVNKVCSTIRAALERMELDEVIPKNPFRRFRKLVAEKKPKHLSPAQLTDFLAEVNGCDDEPLLHYLYIAIGTGLRRKEILNIRREDVDTKKWRVRVSNVKVRNQNERWITIHPALRVDFRYFLNLPVLQPFAWANADTVTHRTKALMQKAGLPDSLHLHSLRHTFATLALENGTGLLFVRNVLGHADIRTTMNYEHIAADGGIPIDLGVDLNRGECHVS